MAADGRKYDHGSLEDIHANRPGVLQDPLATDSTRSTPGDGITTSLDVFATFSNQKLVSADSARRWKERILPMELRLVLRDLLKQRGMTIKQLSDATGISSSTVKTWLGGATPRSMDDLRTVAKFFGVSITYMLFRESEPDTASPQEMPLEHVFTGWLLVDVKRAVPVAGDEKPRRRLSKINPNDE
jgi:transcriptional regulator with XRE-family HTH domain